MEYIIISDCVKAGPDYKIQVKMSNTPYMFISKCKSNINTDHDREAAIFVICI